MSFKVIQLICKLVSGLLLNSSSPWDRIDLSVGGLCNGRLVRAKNWKSSWKWMLCEAWSNSREVSCYGMSLMPIDGAPGAVQSTTTSKVPNNTSDKDNNATGCLVKVKAKFPLRNKQKRRRSIDKVQTKGMSGGGVRGGRVYNWRHGGDLVPPRKITMTNWCLSRYRYMGIQKATTTEATPLVSFTDHDHDGGERVEVYAVKKWFLH